jgi:hypothetical protein
VVELTPVRAWHPNPDRWDANRLVCPVYDTLSDGELARYSGHGFNAARFVPRPRAQPLAEFVPAAASQLAAALHAGAYARDDKPSLYAYGIRYTPPEDIRETVEPTERRPEYLLLGLVGALDLDRQAEGSVALHERTFDDRVEERVALTDATGMSFAPIMAGYHLPDHRVNDRLEELLGLDRRGLSFAGSVPPVAEARLDDTVHRLWAVSDRAAVEELRELLRPVRLLVLDGHHRYTAAVRRRSRGSPSAPLVMLVDGQDRALRLLPWHRVLPAGVVSFPQLLDRARLDFGNVARIGGPASPPVAIDRLRAMRSAGRRGFLAVHGEELYEVQGAPGQDDVGSDFDLLHAFLEERLGVDAHQLLFVRSPRAVFDRLSTPGDPGAGGTGLLLPPLTARGIEERAFGSGRVMAHKSTMFLPKVAEGMIFARAGGGD